MRVDDVTIAALLRVLACAVVPFRPMTANGNGDDGTARGSHRRGLAFVMTGASGVGKDTLRRAAWSRLGDIRYSISATTRPMRPGDVDGVTYHFVDVHAFEALVRDDGLLEWAEYVGDRYGTPRAPVDAALADGHDVLMEVELVGARQVRRSMPEVVSIFVAPPSLAELERRLRGRGTDDEAKIQRRLARARDEIRALPEFDYVIVNDDLDEAAADLVAIVRAERVRASRYGASDVDAFLAEESDTTT